MCSTISVPLSKEITHLAYDALRQGDAEAVGIVDDTRAQREFDKHLDTRMSITIDCTYPAQGS